MIWLNRSLAVGRVPLMQGRKETEASVTCGMFIGQSLESSSSVCKEMSPTLVT